MPIELQVPPAGESITEVQIGEWAKQPGQLVERDEVIVAIDTAKAILEVPAPVTGVLLEVIKKEGEPALVGDVIGILDDSPEAIEKAKAEGASGGSKPAASSSPAAAPSAPAASHSGDDKVMPAAARQAAESGVDLSKVTATGPGGRVLKEDVLRSLQFPAAPTDKPKATPAGNREEEIVPMSPIRQRIAERLVQVQQTAALLTTFNEVDMTAVMELRKQYRDMFQEKHEVKLGFMSFFVKAVVEGLKAFPQINAEIRGTDIVYHNYFDIGIAVGGGKGLVVPILRNAEHLGFADIEKKILDFALRAKANKIKLEELEGGTFTISNGGIYGSLLSTPIPSPPQSGILGLHAIQERPMAVNGQVVIRPMMYIALSYDHRIVDGREAVTFLKRVKEVMENPARLLLEI